MGTHRLRHLVPRFLKTVNSGVGEGSADLQHAIEVVQTTANVRHCCPLLDGGDACCHVAPESVREGVDKEGD